MSPAGYLANDVEIIGKPKLLTKPTHGKLNWHDDGRIDYQPAAASAGSTISSTSSRRRGSS